MSRRSVVVGIDFSEASRIALDHAAVIAKGLGVGLRLFHAWNPTGWSTGAGLPDESAADWLTTAREAAERQLDGWAQELRRPDFEVASELAVGAASRLLPEIAERERAGLLVVGRRGHARLSHVLLGSVSQRVVRTSSCPVLVVPESPAKARLPARMLVGIDFSNASREALRKAIALCRSLASSPDLVLGHAYQDERELWLSDWSETAIARGDEPDEAPLRRWAKEELDDEVQVLYRLAPGHAEQTLLTLAQRKGCDWIVLGVQGRTALASFLIGSTTERILQMADRPVLAVPASEAPISEPLD